MTAVPGADPAVDRPRGLPRWYTYRRRFKTFVDLMTDGPEPNPLMARFFAIVLGQVDAVIAAAEQGAPLVSSWHGNAMEIAAAMGVDVYCPADMLLANQPFTDDLERAHEVASPGDACGLVRQALLAVSDALVPTPTGIVATFEPCSPRVALHERWRRTPEWRGVPVFAAERPDGSTDDDVDAYVGELRRMIGWLEDRTGRVLSEQNLRRVCEEVNRTTRLWQELCVLQRTVPAPMPPFLVPELGWNATQHVNAGNPLVTALFRAMVATAREVVAAGRGAVAEERVRVYWAGLDGTWPPNELGPWLAETYGANVVNGVQGEAGVYRPIDTTSLDSMLRGVARRNLREVPTSRYGRGAVDVLAADVAQAVADYRVDCVLVPGHPRCARHLGCAAPSASVGLVREACREAGVPVLSVAGDVVDPTDVPVDQVQRIVAGFFTIQGWEPLDD
jgi:hypothetical protein